MSHGKKSITSWRKPSLPVAKVQRDGQRLIYGSTMAAPHPPASPSASTFRVSLSVSPSATEVTLLPSQPSWNYLREGARGPGAKLISVSVQLSFKVSSRPDRCLRIHEIRLAGLVCGIRFQSEAAI